MNTILTLQLMYNFLTSWISVRVSQGLLGWPAVFPEANSEVQLLTCHSLPHPDFFKGSAASKRSTLAQSELAAIGR